MPDRASATTAVPPDLRITHRCVVDDIRTTYREGWAQAYVEDHGIVEKFVEMRSQDPEGQEPFRDASKQTGQRIFTFHHFDERGATWYQRRVPFEAGEHDPQGRVVWLLGFRPNHDYNGLAYLGEDLLPDGDDYLTIVDEHAEALSRAVLIEIPELIRRAEAHPGSIVEATVGGGLRLRLHRASDDAAPLLTAAIGTKDIPAGIALDKNWRFRVLSVLFGDAIWEKDLAFDLGGAPLLDDEVAFCCFPQRR
jgi:hypothetical protein